MSLLQDREFLKLWIGQTISEIGSRISREGLPLTAVLLLAATPGQMGILAATGTASVLVFSLAAGVIVDRMRRKPVMIAADVVRALLLATVPIAALYGVLSMAQLLAVAALVGVFTVLFDVAYQAYLPSLVGAETLLDGNRRLAMSAAVAEILGPGMTGVLIQLVTAPIAILLDAVSFLISAVSVAAIRRPEPAPSPTEGLPTRAEIFEGARIVWAHPVLRALAMRSIVAFFSGGILYSLYLLFSIRVLKLSTAELGLVIAMGGVGAFAGAWLSKHVAERYPTGPVFFASAATIGATSLLIPLSAHVPGGGMVLMGMSQLFGDAAWSLYYVSETTYRQRVTDPAALGRANAAMQLASRGILPLGALAGGYLAERTSIVTALWLGTLGICASSLLLLPIAILSGHTDKTMHPIEIDPELSDRALAEAGEKYPEFRGRALRVVARPLVSGFAWQVEWIGEAPSGQEAWEFQNTATRAYKRLAEIAG